MFAATSAYSIGVTGETTQWAADSGVHDRATFLTSAQKLALLKPMRLALFSTPNPDFSGKAMEAYMQRVTAFYANHPDSASMNFAWILQCIQNKPTKSCETVASDFESFSKSH